jgi:hypothetical protein
LFRRRRGDREFQPQGIISLLGDKIHPWGDNFAPEGQSLPLEAKFKNGLLFALGIVFERDGGTNVFRVERLGKTRTVICSAIRVLKREIAENVIFKSNQTVNLCINKM